MNSIAPESPARKRRRIHPSQILLSAALLFLALAMFVPFYWMAINSLLPRSKALTTPPTWISKDLTLENYRSVFEQIPFFRLILNSLKITIITTVGAITTSTLAAYAFARLRFPGRDLLFITLLSALMVPQQVTVIPTFILIKNLGLLDTHEAVYLPALINVFGTFLLRQFSLTIPHDLEDSARLDGAGYLRILWSIIVPLAMPAISALAILVALTAWNDFFWANIFLSSTEKLTLPVGLVMLSGRFGSGSPVVILAALTMIVVPLLVLFTIAQQKITQSIAMSGMKA